MAQQSIDLILSGGRVIDPAQNLDAELDVAIAAGRIAALGPDLRAAAGSARVIDVRGRLVLPGLIDTHAHVYQHVTGSFGLDPGWCGIGAGVTTLVDQGGPSCMTLPGFRKFIVEPSPTRVLAFISAYLVGGLEGHLYPSLYGPEQINVKHTVRAIEENRDLVKGIKAHGEIGGASRWGIESLKLAAEMGRITALPVYVHLGQLWPARDNAIMDPDELVRQVVPLLKSGDILAHPFTRHPGGFLDAAGKVHPVVWEALERGVRVDVGHGSHFSFDMAKRTLDAGILPHTLGADLHGLNVRVPGDTAGGSAQKRQNPFYGVAPFSLAIAMTELLTLGVPLAGVVKMVTGNAAAMLGLQDELGTLEPGRVADVSVLALRSGRWILRDNQRAEVAADRLLEPLFCLRAGQYHEADSPLLPRLPLAA